MSKASMAVAAAVAKPPAKKPKAKAAPQPFGPKHAVMLDKYILKRLVAFTERVARLDPKQHDSVGAIQDDVTTASARLTRVLPLLAALPANVAPKPTPRARRPLFDVGQKVALKADKRAEFPELADDEVENLEVIRVGQGSLLLKTVVGSKVYLPSRFITAA
jgi:hypothetical protein